MRHRMRMLASWRNTYRLLAAMVLAATLGGGVFLFYSSAYLESVLPLESLRSVRLLETLHHNIADLSAQLELQQLAPNDLRRQAVADSLRGAETAAQDLVLSMREPPPAARLAAEASARHLRALQKTLIHDSLDPADLINAATLIDGLTELNLIVHRGALQAHQRAVDQWTEQHQRRAFLRDWMLGMMGLFGLFGFALVWLLRRHRRAIAALQESEAASRELRERLAWILYGAHVGAWEWEAQSDRVNIDERWAAILGYGLDELAPLSHSAWRDFIHPEDVADAERRLAEHLRGETPHYEYECRMRRKDGVWVWVLDRAKVIAWTPSGAALRMAGARLDVTERKQAEERLLRSENHLRAILENIPQGVVVMDAEATILEYNRNAYALFDLPSTLYRRGGDFRAVMNHWADAARLPSEMLIRAHDRLLSPEAFSKEFQQYIQGELRWRLVTHTPLEDGGGIRTFTDITRIKETEAHLRRSNADLEQFAYGVSHDLRQPLRMIRSYGQLLGQRLGERLEEEEKQFFHFIIDGAARMDQMLVSLLEYSRVGRMGEPMAPTASRALLDEALLFLGPAIKEAQAELTVTGDWPELTVSRDEMVRLFQNLIGNAVKYRGEGRPCRIEVAARRDEGEWICAVKDNGVGVPPGQFERLFKVFQRLHARDKYDGAGVGLALCRKIVERHGGRIWGDSLGLNQGCVFTVALPCAQENGAALEPRPAPQGETLPGTTL